MERTSTHARQSDKLSDPPILDTITTNTVDGLSRGNKITNEELRITKLIAEEWLGGVGGARAPVKNIYIRNDELKHSEEFPFLAWLTD